MAVIAASIVQVPEAADHRGARASAEAALAFIAEQDARTAARLRGELHPWLAAAAGSRIGPATAASVRAAGEELKAMLAGHHALWGGRPGYVGASEAADAASRAIAADLETR